MLIRPIILRHSVYLMAACFLLHVRLSIETHPPRYTPNNVKDYQITEYNKGIFDLVRMRDHQGTRNRRKK